MTIQIVMKTIEMSLRDYTYYYTIEKNSRDRIAPIVFINGAFQNMKSWHPISQYLSEWTTTIVLDLPGWGLADHLPANIDFGIYAEAINNVLKEEGVEDVNVISTSYGTPIATQFAKRYPAKIDHLILTAPLMEINPALKTQYQLLEDIISKKDLPTLAEFLFDIGLMNSKEGEKGNILQFELISALFKQQILRLSEDKLQKFMSNTDRIMSYGSSSIAGIENMKTLVLTGQYDTFTSCGEGRALAVRFANAEFYEVPAADHLFLFENPEFATKLISDFLIGSEAAGCLSRTSKSASLALSQ